MERPTLYETGILNGTHFVESFKSHETADGFLHASEYIPVVSTNMIRLERETLVDEDYDIDGLVIELETFSAIKLECRNLSLELGGNLKPIYQFIKKHINQSMFNSSAMKVVNKIDGLTVCRSQGYCLNLTLLPLPQISEQDSFLFIEQGKLFFQTFRIKFAQCLEAASQEEKHRDTLMKNSLYDLKYWDVLPQDQDYVFTLMDRAVNQSKSILPTGLNPVVLLWQFGQKQRVDLDVSSLVHVNAIKHLSIHSAVTLDMSVSNTHLFWSRAGLQDLINTRGSLFSCYTFSEASNFQSNLDGRPLDIRGELRNISRFPRHITFVQLYATTPHRCASKCCPHPISGSIVSCGLLHPQTTSKFIRHGTDYINNVKDNIGKMGHPSCARLEIVTRHDGIPPSTHLNGRTMIDSDQLHDILESRPLMIPFYDEQSEDISFSSVIVTICNHLAEKLKGLFNLHRNRGGFEESWTAFQLELALEQFFFGRCLCPNDTQMSINLGPGSGSLVDRSLTCERGFLALEEPTACASDNCCPPPLEIWTHNSMEQDRIRRMMDFGSSLNGSLPVIGAKLIQVVIGDFKSAAMGNIMDKLTSLVPPYSFNVEKGLSLSALAGDIELSLKNSRYPNVCQVAAKQIKDKGLNIGQVIQSGVEYLNIVFFPSLKRFTQPNSVVRWNKKDLIEVILPGKEKSTKLLSTEISQDVINALVTRDICYESKLKRLQEVGALPWMYPAIQKLRGLCRDRAHLIDICVYITCIAMVQLGMFVQYDKFYALHHKMLPIVVKLKSAEILGPFILSGIHKFQINRLHDSIPHRLPPAVSEPVAPPKKKFVPNRAMVEQQEENMDIMDENGTEEIVMEKAKVHIPACSRGRWATEEMMVMARIVGQTDKRLAYKKYVSECRNAHVPFRDFHSFAYKLNRMQ